MVDINEEKYNIKPGTLSPRTNPTIGLPEMNSLPVYKNYEEGQQEVPKRLFGEVAEVPELVSNQFNFTIQIPTGHLECIATLNRKVTG